MVEIPVTTLPIFKVPIHASYVIYLSTFSRMLALAYWWLALGLCRLTNTPMSLLLHPLDFLCEVDVPKLGFFPGMNFPLEEKMSIVGGMLEALSSKFEVVNMLSHAEIVRKENKSKTEPIRSKIEAKI